MDSPYGVFDSTARNDRHELPSAGVGFRLPIGSEVVEAGFALAEPWKSLPASQCS